MGKFSSKLLIYVQSYEQLLFIKVVYCPIYGCLLLFLYHGDYITYVVCYSIEQSTNNPFAVLVFQSLSHCFALGRVQNLL